MDSASDVLARPLARRWLFALAALLSAALVFLGIPPAPAHAAGTGSISGTVTLPAGSPSAWKGALSVYASGSTGDSGFASVNASTGAYSVTGLDAANYTVHFYGTEFVDAATGTPMLPNVLPEFYNNSSTQAAATLVPVGSGSVTGINAALASAGAITGTVTLPAGSSSAWLKAVFVQVDTLDGLFYASGSLNPTTGAFALNGLATGSYKLHFVIDRYADPNLGWVRPPLLPEFYNNSQTRAAAQTISVTAGSSVTGINATLDSGAGPFTDIDGSAFKTEIIWMYDEGITLGYDIGNGKREFRPTGNVTRDAMAAFLYRTHGSPSFTPPAISPFTDVPTTHQFYKEITWLAASGISGGWDIGGGKKEYRPSLNITRDAMAVFLYRFAGKPAFTPPTTSQFVDVPTSNGFYKEIAWMASTGITTGYDIGGGKREFRPFNPITRDAMAAFLYRYDQLANS